MNTAMTKQATMLKGETLYQSLAAGLVGVWFWDSSQDSVVVDKGLAKLFGVSRKTAASGIPIPLIIDTIHNKDRQKVINSVEKTLASGKRYSCEFRIVNPKGAEHWVMVRGEVQRGQNDEPAGFAGVCIDITDRKTAESERAEMEERQLFMADSMPHLVWITKSDGRHEYYNRRWYDYTGAKKGDFDSQTWLDLCHPDDRKKAGEAWRKSLKTGKTYQMEYRLYNKKSDSYRWVIGRAKPYRNHKGDIVKWYGTSTDIEEQKRSEQRQTFLSNASKTLASSLDYNKTISSIANLGVPEIADWCSVEFYSEEKGFEQVSVAHVDSKEKALAAEFREHNPVTIDQPTGVAAVIRTGKPEFYPLITPEMITHEVEDGKVRDFMLSLHLRSIIIAPILIKEKPAGAITFVSSDSGRYYNEADFKMVEKLAARISLAVTNATLYNEMKDENSQRKKLEKDLLLEQQKLDSRIKERTAQLYLTNQGLRQEIIKRHEAEEEIKAYSEELTRSNQELQDFAYVASHDLQEPLRKIQAFGGLLKSEYEDKLGDGKDYLDRMLNASSRMSSLIEDLLSFSRVSHTKYQAVPVDLNVVVADVLIDLEARIDETDGRLDISSLPTVAADPTHMRQLFQNLIGNALKFHQPDVPPVVKISSLIDKKDAIIYVDDNGIGFDEKYLDRIFSVFQQLHGKEAYQGTGIGLAVCRKIIEKYGGTITAESKKGRGSRFIIVLPIHRKG